MYLLALYLCSQPLRHQFSAFRRHDASRYCDDLLDDDGSSLAVTSMLTIYRRSARGAEGQTAAGLRPPNAEDWKKWKSSIVGRYKAIPARLFIQEMEAVGLRVTWA